MVGRLSEQSLGGLWQTTDQLRILDITTGRATVSVTLPEKFSFGSIIDDDKFLVTFKDTDCEVATVGYLGSKTANRDRLKLLKVPDMQAGKKYVLPSAGASDCRRQGSDRA